MTVDDSTVRNAVADDATDPAVLHGSECTVCGTVGFPAGTYCSRCATATARPRELSTRGTVWAYTVQRFAPKSPPYVPPPEGFSPFAMGYVELPEGIRVAGILEADTVEGLQGAPATLIATQPVPRFLVLPEPTADQEDRR
ncbi:Zn-ribbon domain-containing OB-fold protein [Gordonia metallireducens]|uniref:Zn-ribbon domain-containing OB-fold protein n=1 Tax=Gordonia metallireducens TaxID=2897779 RepID=UPI001E65523B|nr:OB-fold domain-containing protein [Gordonia metallireducens]